MHSLNIGLSRTTITKLQTIFLRHSNIQKVFLYGSRAKGNFKNGSDIDLTLMAPKLGVTELLKIENEIDDLLLPYKVDLSLYHLIDNQDLRAHIDRVAVDFLTL